MNRTELSLVGLLALTIAASVAVLPMAADARPAFEIPVHDSVQGDSLQRADGEAWDGASPVTVPLSSAGAGVPNADDTSVQRTAIQAAQTERRLYIRLSWADGTRDRSAGSVRTFPDSVAVQIPRNATARPPIAMGGSSNEVNVWYWSAGGETEELLAGGPGSTTPFEQPRVSANASYSDGRWSVVFSRALEADSPDRTAIPTSADMDVAVAVWNGSNMERSGQKAASSWYYLALGPGPSGPPYETILWVVAGIAIITTTLVTIEGVRRTRGE